MSKRGDDKQMKALWSSLMMGSVDKVGEESKEPANTFDLERDVAAATPTPTTAADAVDVDVDVDVDDDPEIHDPFDDRCSEDEDDDADEMFTWDIVFVFAVGEDGSKVKVWDAEKNDWTKVSQKEQFKRTTAMTVKKLEAAGLKTDMYLSVQKDEVYVRIAATEQRLRDEADRIDIDVQLDERKCLEYGEARGIRLARATLAAEASNIDETAWQSIYGKFDQFDEQNPHRIELYIRHDDDARRPRSFFSSVERLRLTVNCIEADEKLGGSEISMVKMIAEETHSMLAWFPLHEGEKKRQLRKEWIGNSFKDVLYSMFTPPLDSIRAYFGENIAFYFAFLAFYNRALVPIAILGIATFVWQLIEGRIDVVGVVIFGFIVAVWTTIFLEFWKRFESKYRVKWGMAKFLEKEQARPEFKGTWEPSPVDGRQIEVFPWRRKVIRMMMSQSVIWTLIAIVIGSVITIFKLRTYLSDNGFDPETTNIATAFINAIQIQILNMIYSKVSYLLNDWENHRTDTEYENALIAKTFIFKFVNSYNSLFYIAFLKRHDSAVGGCINNNCLGELQQQLGTIFVASIIINNLMETLVPMLQNRWAEYSNRASVGDGDGGDGGMEMKEDRDPEAPKEEGDEEKEEEEKFKEKSVPEREYELSPYNSTFEDFDELVIQYGYVTLFVVAFPLAPLLALINNAVETWVDSTKLLKQSRRPEPRGAANIGTWYAILEIVSVVAVITNALIVVFTTEMVNEWVGSDPAWKGYSFIAAEHLILLLKFSVAYFVPDEPGNLKVHLARQDYIVNVLLLGLEEEDEVKEAKEHPSSAGSQDDFDWDRVSATIRNTGHEH